MSQFAVVRITRTLVYDDHPFDGGKRPDIDLNTMRLVLDDTARTPQTRPVVRTYTVRLAVPSSRTCTWDVGPGDDFRLLIATRGFTQDANTVSIDGRVKSNYQLQLDENKAPIGPNAFGFVAQAIGKTVAVEILNDEATGRIYHEFDETQIECITSNPPNLAIPTEDSEDAQMLRWKEWTVIRKQGLR